MKQFLNVLKFELGNYFKSRSFMVTTVLLALVVAAAVALPPVFMKGSFSDVFGGERKQQETAESSSGADDYDPDAALLGIADPEGFVSNLAGLTDRMPGYQWKVFDSADELEQFVEAGGVRRFPP